jgi:hypothetical protein
MVTFQLHRNGVILIVILCVIVAVLLVTAGYVWGKQSAVRPAAAVVQTPARPKPAEPAPLLRYTLRIGIEATEEEAQAAVKQLAARKLAATIVPVETSGGAVLYEIRTGAYPDRAAAAKAATALQDEHRMPAAVVPAQ